MNRILFSILTIVVAVLAVVGGTGAFFGDRELSSGNTFAAGALDLKVDNDSYYNGNRCVNVSTDPTHETWQWVGQAGYPMPGTPCSTSWNPDDLGNGRLFFNFTDLKPDDEGEDTISLHAENDAWACMDLSLTSNDDTSSTEPELGAGDTQEDPNNTWDGELADNLAFAWWADDGDNVYEEGEHLLSDGVQSLGDLLHHGSSSWSVALADSEHNVWTPGQNLPLSGESTHYLAKAWCLGTMTPTPVAQDDKTTDGPQVRGTGFSCDGAALGNETQTDRLTVDIAFRAAQARDVPDFTCGRTNPRLATLTVNKVVVSNNGGNNVVSDFQLQVVGTVVTNVTSGVPTQFAAGDYTVTETGISGYQASFSGDCNAAGQITLAENDSKTCTITNTERPANITLIKQVVNNNGGTALPANFTLRIDGNVVPNNTSYAVTSNTAHYIDEDAYAGYTLTSITGSGCPAATSTPIVLNEGESITCTLTNDDTAPVQLLSDSFGTGGDANDIPNWDEEGSDSDSSTLARQGQVSGEDTESPNGGRFAKIGDGEWICRATTTTGYTSLALQYSWKGDADAEDGEAGVVEYRIGGGCTSASGWTNAASHELDDTNNNADEGWSGLQTVGVSGSGTMYLRFRNGANDAGDNNEYFRIDNVILTGVPN